MIQSVLFDLLERGPAPEPDPLPPHNGTETSRAAAESMKDHVNRLRRVVLDAFKAAGPDGLTCKELEAITGLAHETASPRMIENARAGLIVEKRDEAGAVVKRKTPSKRAAAVWVAATVSSQAP